MTKHHGWTCILLTTQNLLCKFSCCPMYLLTITLHGIVSLQTMAYTVCAVVYLQMFLLTLCSLMLDTLVALFKTHTRSTPSVAFKLHARHLMGGEGSQQVAGGRQGDRFFMPYPALAGSWREEGNRGAGLGSGWDHHASHPHYHCGGLHAHRHLPHPATFTTCIAHFSSGRV